MRAFLDRLYSWGLALASAAFACIAALVLLQILGRLIDRGARALGASAPGLTIPSLAEIGTFLFVGGVFLGMAGTLQAGGHIRVTLLTRSLPEAASRALGTLVGLCAVGLAGFATWASALQVLDSWTFDSVSYGVIPIPLWLPQSVMTLGLALFLVALIDATLTLARGGTPAYETAEDSQGGH